MTTPRISVCLGRMAMTGMLGLWLGFSSLAYGAEPSLRAGAYVEDVTGSFDSLRSTKNPALKGLVEPKGIVTIASGHDKRNIVDFNAEGHRPRVGDEQTIAEIIYWERPQGGRVFHTGSIATAWAMFYDESLSNLVRNVLHHFKVTPKK